MDKMNAMLGRKTAAAAAADLHDETGAQMYKYKLDEVDDERRSIASVADRAQNAAKQLFKVFAPQDELEQDTRDLLTPVGTQVELAQAKLKLESMSHSSIVFTVSILYFAAIVSLVIAILVSILTSQRTSSLNSAAACFAIEGIARTLAVLMVIFLTIFFTFRVLVYAKRTRNAALLPEQLLLIIFLVLIMITPGMSVYSPYLFWLQYRDALEFAKQPFLEAINVSQGEAFSIYFFASNDNSAAKIITGVFTLLVLWFGMLFLGLTIFFFGKPHQGRSTSTKQILHPLDDGANGANLEEAAVERNQLHEHEEDTHNETHATVWEALAGCFGDYKRLILGADLTLVILAFLYLTMSLVLTLVFEYLPSQVPLVGMISILKVCPAQSEVNNQTVNNCDPSVLNGVPFARAMSITAQFLLEVGIGWYLHQLTKRTRFNLKRLPYETNRVNHLGFRYFNANKRMTFFFILLGSIIVVSVSGEVFATFDIIRERNGTFTATYDPLRQVGINFFGLGFGSFYLLLACFLFTSALAYLPPDSRSGIRGFCCGGQSAVIERDIDHPVYIIRESDIELLRRVREEARVKMLRERKRQRRRQGFFQQSRIQREAGGSLLFNLPISPGPAPQPTPNVARDVEAGQSSRPDNESPRPPHGQTPRPPYVQTPRPYIQTPRPPRPHDSTQSHSPRQALIGSQARSHEDDEHTDDDEEDLHQQAHHPQQQQQQHPDLQGRLRARQQRIQEFFQGGALQPKVTDKYKEQYLRLAALLRPKPALREVIKQNRHADTGPMSLIEEQMNANLFCMETEVLLLNFSFISYCFGSFKDVLPISNMDKQSLLGKHARYRLITHLENALTDIQACVFVDRVEDHRIYVAFRGTSTSKNIWQDLDYAQIPHEAAKDVEPFVVNPEDVISKGAAMTEPRVHRGFYLAYLSIREAVMGVVSDLIDSMPQGCVVFSCGHSLGGALATHFGFDIGLKYKVRQSNVRALQVTTFGSPRVGNFSYACRHKRVVPTTHRFCIGGDPVPKLPPARPLADFTKWGYFHIGVEVLLDVERVNLLVGPLFIERQIQHGWGGYVPKNHVTGGYVLALALWCARVHPQYTPDWWLPVVNHVLKAERERLRRITGARPLLSMPIADQLYKEGAVIWTDDARAMQNRGVDTGALEDEASTYDSEWNLDSPEEDEEHNGVQTIEKVLASCGVLHRRHERAKHLFDAGFTSLERLSRASPKQLQALSPSDDSDLMSDDFTKLVTRCLSANRCPDCMHAPLVCPRCTQSRLELA